jgi:hypothetical protein
MEVLRQRRPTAPESPEYFGLLMSARPWHTDGLFPCAATGVFPWEDGHVLFGLGQRLAQ